MSKSDRVLGALEQLRFADEQLTILRSVDSIPSVDPTVLSAIKQHTQNALNNLRQALEYIATEIRTSHCSPTCHSVGHFPIHMTPQDFTSKMNGNFPDLKTRAPRIYSYLESIQPYKPGFRWLSDFNECVIFEAKHDDFEGDRRRRLEIGTKEKGAHIGPLIIGKGVSGKGTHCTIDGVPLPDISFKPDLNGTKELPPRTEFKERGTPVCEVLGKYHEGISKIVKDLQHLL